ncbi:MAG: response regulator [Fuerstiella sp.]
MTVLFVDDDRQVLRALERMLDAAEVEWDAEFTTSGPDALALLAEHEFQAIVTDMRMPGMDGAELLQEVSRHHPEVIRIVLSGQADKQTVLRAVKPMHQYLSKPCDTETLKSTVSRACAMRNRLNSDSLRGAVGNLPGLPSLPTVYARLMEAVKSDGFTLGQVGEIIEQDIAMTGKILQLVNSAAFGLNRTVSSPCQAASLLGLETIKSLTLATGVFQECVGDEADHFSLNSLMTHSLAVADCARRICRAEHMPVDTVNEAFTAGMLHDIGKLVLATSCSEAYSRVAGMAAEEQIPAWQAERRIFGADHSAVGAYLLNLWGLPQSIVEVVALHHSPELAQENCASLLSIVCTANLLCNDAPDEMFAALPTQIDGQNRLPVWREYCSNMEDDN